MLRILFPEFVPRYMWPGYRTGQRASFMFGRLSSCGQGAPSFDPAGWLQARWLRFPSCCKPKPALAATTWGRDSYRASTGLALVRFPLGVTRPHCQPGRPFKQGPPDLRREVTWPLVVCRERERERRPSCPAPLARRENANQLLAARAAATRPCSVNFASLIGKEIK